MKSMHIRWTNTRHLSTQVRLSVVSVGDLVFDGRIGCALWVDQAWINSRHSLRSIDMRALVGEQTA